MCCLLWRGSGLPDIVARMDLRGWDVRIVAMGAAVAVLAGCGGDPEPVVTPTPTPTEAVAESPSPTPSPSPTELTEEEILAAIPENAQLETFDGAQAFVKFYVQLFPELFRANGDPELFSLLSDPGCTFCMSALENARQARADDLSTRGGSITFPDFFGTGGEGEDGDWLVEHRYVEDEIEYLDADGNVVETDSLRQGTVVALIFFAEGHWSVRNIAFEYDDVS